MMLNKCFSILLIVIVFSSISFAEDKKDIDQSTPLKTFEVFYEGLKKNDSILVKKCLSKKTLKFLEKVAVKNKCFVKDYYLLFGAALKDLENIKIEEVKEFYSSGYIIMTGIYKEAAQYNKKRKERIPAREFKQKVTFEFTKEEDKWKVKTYKKTW